MNHSEHINELACALSKAQGEILPALKDNVNPHFKSKYADLNSVWNACREPLSKNGLSVIQTTCEDNGRIVLITTLVHSSGQWIKSSLPLIMTKNDSHGLGSALTYSRRFSLAAMVGVAPDEDDDGNASVAPKTSKTEIKPAQFSVPATLTNEQYQEIVSLIGDDAEYTANMLSFFKVSTLKDIPYNKFKAILNSCIRRKQELSLKEGSDEAVA